MQRAQQTLTTYDMKPSAAWRKAVNQSAKRQLDAPVRATVGIGRLNQHFNDAGAGIAPWQFVPRENIKEFSTARHPGLATIFEAGAGTDVKGLLKDPIGIDDFRLPWECQTSLVQSFNATAGVGAKKQVNIALGMNVAVTFSDPDEWPKDRSQRPADTRTSYRIGPYLVFIDLDFVLR